MQVLGKTTLAAPYPVVGQAIQSKIIFQSLDASSREYTLPAPYPGGRSENDFTEYEKYEKEKISVSNSGGIGSLGWDPGVLVGSGEVKCHSSIDANY